MKRPLEALELPYYYKSGANGTKVNLNQPPWRATKATRSDSPYAVTLGTTPLDADEVRQLHAWLGEVVSDLNAGV